MNYSDQAKAIQRIDLDLKFSSRNFIPEQQNNYTNFHPFQIKENLNSHLYTHVIPYAASIKDSARAQVKEIDVDKQIRQESFSQQSSEKNQKDFHLHQKIKQIIENSDLEVQDKMEKIRQTQRSLQNSYPEYEYANKGNLSDNQNQGIERYAYINQRQMQQQQEYQQQIYELNQQQSLKPMYRQTGTESQQYPFQNQEAYNQYFSQIPIQPPIQKNVQTSYKPNSTNKRSKRQASPQRKTSTASQTIEANQGINQENTFQRQSKKFTYQQNLLDSQKFYEPTPPSQTVELALKLKANQKELNRIQGQQQARSIRKQDKTNYQINPRNSIVSKF